MSLFHASQQWSTMLSQEVKSRLESQLSRMNCQMFSTGFSSGHLAGRAMMLILAGTELAGHVPTGLIHQHDRVSAGCDGERYLVQMQGHGFGIAEGQHQPCALAVFRADRAKDVGRFRPLILGRRWPCPASRPAPRDLVLLTNAGFVLEPYLYGRALREGVFDLCQLGSEAPFLKAFRA